MIIQDAHFQIRFHILGIINMYVTAFLLSVSYYNNNNDSCMIYTISMSQFDKLYDKTVSQKTAFM